MKLKKIITSAFVALFLSLSVFTINVSADSINELHPLGCIEPTDEEFDEYMVDNSDDEDNVQAGALPSKIDLSSKLPTPKNQGSQGSCVAFAVAYATKTYQENLEFNWGVSSPSTQFSPAFLYNQLNGGKDKGLNIKTTLEFLKTNGVCSLADMPYNDSDYLTQPNNYQKERASNFKISNIIAVEGQSGIKEELSKGNPVIVAINVYSDFDNLNTSNMIYDVANGSSRGSHAVCIIGYDDSMQAYKIINSWGTNWGINGYGYISYDLFANALVSKNKGYVITNSIQHYKSNPLGVKTNTPIEIYSDTALKTKVGTLNSNESIGIISYIAAANGNPPVLKINGGYITAKTSETTILNRFNIHYDSNGGTGTMTNTIVPYGVSTKLSENLFVNTGHTFSGWYAYRTSDQKWLYLNTQTNTTGWFTEGSEPDMYIKYLYRDKQTVARTSSVQNDTVIFYAQWTPNTYTVIYDANGGNGSMNNTIVTYGINTALSTHTFTKTGYSFAGWNAKRASDSKWFYVNESTNKTGWYIEGSQPDGYKKMLYRENQIIARSTSVNNDTITFYAQWKAHTFTVVYNSNGGNGSMQNSIITYGIYENLRENTFTKSGYKFIGWYAKRSSDNKWIYKNPTTGTTGWYIEGAQPAGYSKSLYPDNWRIAYTSPIDKDTVTFYAQWEKI